MDETESHADPQRPAPAPPVTPNFPRAAAKHPIGYQEHRESNRIARLTQRWVRATAFMTAIYTVFTALLWCTTKESLESTQRARVVFHGVEGNDDVVPDRIHVAVKNTGNTAAEDVRMSVRAEWNEFREPGCAQVSGPASAVGPDMLRNVTVKVRGQPPRKGGASRHLHVVGAVTYSDVFNHERRTDFCLVLDARQRTGFRYCRGCNGSE